MTPIIIPQPIIINKEIPANNCGKGSYNVRVSEGARKCLTEKEYQSKVQYEEEQIYNYMNSPTFYFGIFLFFCIVFLFCKYNSEAFAWMPFVTIMMGFLIALLFAFIYFTLTFISF